jgi:hypothetical protein
MPESRPPRPDELPVPRWVPLLTAPDQLTAEMWLGLLETQNIPATLAPADVVSFLGVSGTPCRLLVPESLAEAAERLLENELGGLGDGD